MATSLNTFLAGPAPALTSALIAAAVAVFVMALSQYFIFKKGRTDYLTPKLEQLYLLLNELSEHNATQFKLHHAALSGDPAARAKISEMDELDIYGLRRAKKIVMYVRLYFPKLSHAHQMIFAAERDLNHLQHAATSSTPPDSEALLLASGRVGHLLMLMEEELITNRDLLLGVNVFPRPYRFASDAEITNERPPPAGDPFAPTPGEATCVGPRR